MANNYFEFFVELEINEELVSCIAEVRVGSYFPAKLFALPENCYPSEGGEVEIQSVVRKDTNEEISFKLNKNHFDIINEMAFELFFEQDDYYQDEKYYDDYYDKGD